MSSKKKKFFLIFALFLFSVFYLLISQDSFIVNFSRASNVPTDNSGCYELEGYCDWGRRDKVGQSCTLPDGSPGTVEAYLCGKYSHSDYRCCVPDEEEEEEIPDRVYRDRACEYIAGQCSWVSGTPSGDIGECTVYGQPGCYVYGACRAEAHEMRDGNLYLCCTADENLCGQGVDYSVWRDVFINERGCPFTDPSESNDEIDCNQGPETNPSHLNYDWNTLPSIDVGLTDGNRGTEYFIAPEDGYIIRAVAFTESNAIIKKGQTDNPKKIGQVQKCGCDLRFEGDSGIIYEIRHCFVFTGISTHFHSSGRPKEGEPIRIKKGTVLAKMAVESDDSIIDFLPFEEGCRERNDCSCTTGAHFHVKVTKGEDGDIDRCVDCHFVDDFGCNLVNPEGVDECGRCRRRQFPPYCFGDGRVADWGGVKCDNKLPNCAGCNNDSDQYCCESDRVWCCQGPPTAEICDWVCKCPHPTPTGPGWVGSSDGNGDSDGGSSDWFEGFR